MEPFENLGRTLRERWAAYNFDQDRFAPLATEALSEARLHERCAQRDVVRWLARTETLPRQGGTGFGQPPVNLYRDDRLYIEALFWVDGTTTIHQHAFSGAFCVLEGSSVHASYRFAEQRRLSEQLRLGTLTRTGVELLAPGQVRSILAGPEFIHALFHLERPTLSLVVRSHEAREHAIQYDYHPPGLALDPFCKPESLMRRLAVLNMLLESEHPELTSFVETFSERADAFALTLLLQQLNAHLRGFTLVGPVLERARERFPELAQPLSAALANDRSAILLASRRKALVKPELRFLLGVLLNVSGRTPILTLVRARVPDRDPVQTVLGWLREMHATSAEGGNALGIELDDDGFWILERLLAGRSEAEICAEAAHVRSRLSAAQIAQLGFMLPFNSVLGPLLQSEPSALSA